MPNGFTKYYNTAPKLNSKAQQSKKANERTYEKVVCAGCGKSNVTLYKTVFGTYECKDCKNSCELRRADTEV